MVKHTKRGMKKATDNARIADALLAEIRRQQQSKVIDLKAVIAARTKAEEQQRTISTPQRLAHLHPAHAAYVYAQNQLAVMMEELSGHRAMKPLSKIVA